MIYKFLLAITLLLLTKPGQCEVKTSHVDLYLIANGANLPATTSIFTEFYLSDYFRMNLGYGIHSDEGLRNSALPWNAFIAPFLQFGIKLVNGMLTLLQGKPEWMDMPSWDIETPDTDRFTRSSSLGFKFAMPYKFSPFIGINSNYYYESENYDPYKRYGFAPVISLGVDSRLSITYFTAGISASIIETSANQNGYYLFFGYGLNI